MTMSFSYYEISRFEDDEVLNDRQWTNISNFIERFGVEKIEDYLSVENDFVKFLRMLYIKLSTRPQKEYGMSWLGFGMHVFSLENVENEFLFGLSNVEKRLQELVKLNINYISDNDLNFILTCWIRGLCSIQLFELGNGSYIKASDEDFTFSVMLHDNWKLSDIFIPKNNVYFHKSIDPNL
ncbi:hypothetical protein [Psychrobacter sp. JB193]|uniref:hypothetical protein n=2 Tax=Psychrobacter TaxID=497 RepID=UPI000BAB1FDE|nr:hypothetical protein [Psychrobacter sp. JB193]PAT63019.1 hypothetical protein CIK80_10680 [Psychrobacter sp. JB193]